MRMRAYPSFFESFKDLFVAPGTLYDDGIEFPAAEGLIECIGLGHGVYGSKVAFHGYYATPIFFIS